MPSVSRDYSLPPGASVESIHRSIEALVAVFHFSRENPANLPYAAAIGLTAAGLLVGWGFFIRQNEVAERLEPEAMQAAKSEDRKIEASRSSK